MTDIREFPESDSEAGHTSPRVAFVTLGCKVNQAESEAIASELGGHVGCVGPSDAEVVVVNTCTVTGEADRKARKAIRHALGLPGSPTIVATGCLAAIDAGGLAALGNRVVVEPDKERVAERVCRSMGLEPGARVLRQAASAPDELPTAALRRARVQVKVEDGCDAFCTYCVVPYARGVPRSVPLEEVAARAAELSASGVAEVVLTGINIGRYDSGAERLPELLEAVARSGIIRIRLSSVEPGDVSERLLDAAARTSAFCPHLHVPLQSGSDSVLARMGRPYTAAAFAETVERAHHAFPRIAISTDVIAGFPGETDAEFAETLAFVESQRFSRLHVFRYSPREGTPAAIMPGQVSPRVKAERASALRALGSRLSAEFARSLVGVPLELLVERTGEATVTGAPPAEGTTREYLRLSVAIADARPGVLVPVVIESVEPDGTPAARALV